jgi:hypothetical protein
MSDNTQPKLLREYYFLESSSIQDANGLRRLHGLFSEANKKNQNGRIYPKQILEREIDKLMKLVTERRAIGELDHPDVSTVQLSRASHLITELRWDGDTLFGEIEILPTEHGRILESLVKAGVKPCISSRSVGSTKRTDDGTELVQDDLQLITFDVVSHPSFTNAILTESQIIELQHKNRYILINSILDDILK